MLFSSEQKLIFLETLCREKLILVILTRLFRLYKIPGLSHREPKSFNSPFYQSGYFWIQKT